MILFRFVFAILAVVVAPSAFAQDADSCFGVIDFADEITVDGITETGRTDLGTGLERLELEVTLENTTDGEFSRAEAFPDEQAVFDGYGGRVFAPAIYETIDPNATVTPTAALLVDIPSANVDQFVTDLTDGTLSTIVHAEQVPELQDDVSVHEWTSADEVAYLDGDNLEPVGPVYTFRLDYPDGAPQAFVDAAAGNKLWIEPQTGLGTEVIPAEYHFLRATSVLVGPSPNGVGDQVDITAVESGDQEDLAEIYASATLCNAPATGFCSSRGGTRSGANNDTSDPEEADQGSRPIRFNALANAEAGFELSGQFHPVCIRPIFVVKLRRGDSRFELGVRGEVELAMNFSASLESELAVSEEIEVGLGDVCFPVANLTMGPVTVTLAAELSQAVFARAAARAGTNIGWSHRVEFGLVVVCETGQGCRDEIVLSGPPFAFTPPQLAHVADATVSTGARIGAALYIGSAIYPACDDTAFGGRAGLEAEIAGNLVVQPLETPWYELALTAGVEASASVDVLGFSIVELETELVDEEFVLDPAQPPATSAPDPDTQARWVSGEDQRWAVALEQQDVSNAFGIGSDVAATDDGGVAVVADSRLFKLDRYGQLEWFTRYTGNSAPSQLYRLPDDRLLTLLRAPAGYAVHESTDGAIVDARNYVLAAEDGNGGGMAANAMTFIDLGNGDYDIVLAGEVGRDGLVTSDGGGLVRISRTGAIRWAKIYNRPGIQELHDVTVARNGDIIAVGRTGNPWIVRVDADTGELIWSKELPFARGGNLETVREAPDGTIYAAGTRGAIIFQASAIVASITPDGSDAKHVIFAHDRLLDQALDFEPYPYPPVGIEQAPEDYATFTPGDDVADLEIDGDGIVLSVRVGNPLRSGWLVHLGPDLAPAWFLVFDGRGRDGFASVDVVSDGYFVGFRSDSVVPDGEPADSEMWAGVMKVPFGGAMSLHPDFSEVALSFQSIGVNNSSGNSSIVGDGGVIVDSAVDTLDNLLSVSNSLRTTLVASAPQQECAVVLTETGRQVAADGCPPQPDRARPIVRILEPTATSIYSVLDTLVVEVQISDDVGVVSQTLQVNDQLVTAGDPLDLEAFGVGVHVVAATATDAEGQTAVDEVAFTVVDDVPPVVDIQTPSEGQAVSPDTTPVLPLVIVVTDAHGRVVRTEVTLDGEAVLGQSLNVAALDVGEHLLRVEVVDDSGNAASAEVTFVRLAEGEADTPPDNGVEVSCSGCASGGGPSSVALLLGFVAVAARRRRR